MLDSFALTSSAYLRKARLWPCSASRVAITKVCPVGADGSVWKRVTSETTYLGEAQAAKASAAKAATKIRFMTLLQAVLKRRSQRAHYSSSDVASNCGCARAADIIQPLC